MKERSGGLSREAVSPGRGPRTPELYVPSPGPVTLSGAGRRGSRRRRSLRQAAAGSGDDRPGDRGRGAIRAVHRRWTYGQAKQLQAWPEDQDVSHVMAVRCSDTLTRPRVSSEPMR